MQTTRCQGIWADSAGLLPAAPAPRGKPKGLDQLFEALCLRHCGPRTSQTCCRTKSQGLPLTESARRVHLVTAMSRIGRLTFLVLLVVFAGCDDRSKQSRRNVSTQPAQKVTALTEADLRRLQEQRAVVEKFLADDALRQKYQRAAGKLGTIHAVFQANVFKPNQTRELQCLGIVLGDAFVQELKGQWVMVEDQYGRDPAVRLPGTTILLFPLTMLSKRVEEGENVDVFQLFGGVVAEVDDIKRRGG